MTFAGVLRGLRREARLTQEELAEAAGLSVRAISDLERGVVATPQKETVRLLADALGLTGPARGGFEGAARGHAGPGAALGGEVAAVRALPRDIASFTGRERELDALAQAAAAGTGAVVSIHAIGGMAGVGKTAFAVHAAHRLADRFPGGQIFLPLHGHTPGQQPVDPADALVTLLLAAGVAPGQIPDGTQARMSLWRDQAAGRQLLLVLDDAVGSEQVVPLLPGAGGSLVLVTSRRRMSALEDATPVSLDTLPAPEAAALLVRLAGRAGLGTGDRGVQELTGLCGFLPLAIGMIARQLHHHPAWSLAGRAAELASARDRLELMATENLSVAAAFDLSYAELDTGLQLLFRRLGLHPGSEVDGYAAAALHGTGLTAARRGLEALYDQYLLTEPAAGRYRMHDLLREHSRALAGRTDPEPDRELATTRLLDYYQHTATLADTQIARHTRPGPAAADGPVPAAVPALADSEEALVWARTERVTLFACLDRVTGTGQHNRVVALTAGLAGLLRRDGPWSEAITRHEAAIAAAGHLGDRLGQAGALNDLGELRFATGDFPPAAQAHEQALGIYRDLGDRLGEANALWYLGQVRRMVGDYPAGVQTLEQALHVYREIGDRVGQAATFSTLGRVQYAMSDFPSSAGAQEQALEVYRDLGAPGGEVETLNEMGALHRADGDLARAEEYHRRALELARAIVSPWDEAHALAGLGRCARAAGRTAEASAGLRQALEIFQRLGSPEADGISRELAAPS